MAALVCLAAVWFATHPSSVPPIDAAWQRLMLAGDLPVALDAARVLDLLGHGVIGFVVLPLVVAGCLWRRGPRAMGLVIASSLLSLGAAQLLKHLVERQRPAPTLVPSDLGSFPSGHVMNVATLAVVVLLTVPRWRVAVIGRSAVVVMAVSRTYLNVHWLTDTLAGAALGAAVPILLAAAVRFGAGAGEPSSARLRWRE
ncbi:MULTISPECIES: phosphatase PAP2 family protein [unclassified Microbacterium]|uniref:phosphatase PAP2 family protein n=1 Tax=unclassified Microbacterium TaxID=2609290 RepID=UPI003744E33F